MSQFKEWIKNRRLKESIPGSEDPVANFKFNTDDQDFADDRDQVESEMFKTLLRKYPEETMDFIHTIAQRGDHQIAMLLRKLDKGNGPRLMKEPRHPSQDDEIVPAIADTGHNAEQD